MNGLYFKLEAEKDGFNLHLFYECQLQIKICFALKIKIYTNSNPLRFVLHNLYKIYILDIYAMMIKG